MDRTYDRSQPPARPLKTTDQLKAELLAEAYSGAGDGVGNGIGDVKTIVSARPIAATVAAFGIGVVAGYSPLIRKTLFRAGVGLASTWLSRATARRYQ